jgi:hypothetical protein
MSNFTDTDKFLKKLKIKKSSGIALLPDDVMKSRYAHMIEEVNEFQYSNNMSDIHGCVDALIDVVYIALGTANMLGLNEDQWNECWDKVHAANMSKELSLDTEGHKLGVKKPANFIAPDFASVLGAE